MGFTLAEDDDDDDVAATEEPAAEGEAEAEAEAETAAEAEAAAEPEASAEAEPEAPKPLLPPVFKHPAELVPIPLVPLEKVQHQNLRAAFTPANILVNTPATEIPVLTSDEINTLKIRREQVLRRLQEVRKIRPLPKQHEPHRQEVHHDCVMKEMVWLA